MAKKQKSKLTKYEKWFRTLHRLVSIFYKPLFPFRKYGHKENFDERNYIFVCNHLSLLDVILVAVATKKPIHFLAKKELFEKGLMRKFVLKCECIPVNRDGNDVKAVMQAMKCLKNGENIAIFPEGTRNKSNETFLPFKSGASALSIKTKTPIVPIVQIKKARFLRRSHVYYGEPIEFDEYYGMRLTDEDIEKCDGILFDKMQELHEKLSSIVKKGKKNK